MSPKTFIKVYHHLLSGTGCYIYIYNIKIYITRFLASQSWSQPGPAANLKALGRPGKPSALIYSRTSGSALRPETILTSASRPPLSPVSALSDVTYLTNTQALHCSGEFHHVLSLSHSSFLCCYSRHHSAASWPLGKLEFIASSTHALSDHVHNLLDVSTIFM